MVYRYLWLALGSLALAVGVIGIFLPLLPTTPFLLLASFCFARGSRRFELWLLSHPRLGPPVLAWREHGAISRRVKFIAITTIMVSGTLTFKLDRIPLYGRVGMGLTLAAAALFIATRPSSPGHAKEHEKAKGPVV